MTARSHTGAFAGQPCPLMAPSGGDAGGNKEERDRDGRLAEEGVLVEWDDGPPGTSAEWSPPSPVISRSILRSSGRDVEAGEDTGDG